MTSPFRSAGRTDIGKARRRNEDAILVRGEAGLWAVADGLGGHADGDFASRLVVERLASLPRVDDVLAFVESIEDTLAGVNAELCRAARARGADLIGSTVVVLVYGGAITLCGWAGDSRGYCCDDGRLMPITRDHLYGIDDAERWSGGPTQTQPSGGVLTRAIGADTALFMDWAVAINRPGMQFVLCSDGVNKEMSDAEIESACDRHCTPDGVLDELFETSLQRGARDNLSAVIVNLAGEAPAEGSALDERVRVINRDLSVLDEAHRLGEIDRDDYRARRRRLLAGLIEAERGSAHARAISKRSRWRFGWQRWFRRR